MDGEAEKKNKIERIRILMDKLQAPYEQRFRELYPVQYLTIDPAVYMSSAPEERLGYILNTMVAVFPKINQYIILKDILYVLVHWAPSKNITLNIIEIFVAVTAQLYEMLEKAKQIENTYAKIEAMQIDMSQPRFTVEEYKNIIAHKIHAEAYQILQDNARRMCTAVKEENEAFWMVKIANLQNKLKERDITIANMLMKSKQNFPNKRYQLRVKNFAKDLLGKLSKLSKTIHAEQKWKAIGILHTIKKRLERVAEWKDPKELDYNVLLLDYQETFGGEMLLNEAIQNMEQETENYENFMKLVNMEQWNKLSIQHKVAATEFIQNKLKENESFDDLLKEVNKYMDNAFGAKNSNSNSSGKLTNEKSNKDKQKEDEKEEVNVSRFTDRAARRYGFMPEEAEEVDEGEEEEEEEDDDESTNK